MAVTSRTSGIAGLNWNDGVGRNPPVLLTASSRPEQNCQNMLLGQAGREMLESDWTSGCFCLSCHNFEPFIEREELKN